MTLAVIADIHSNHLALRAALDIVDNIAPDGVIFLGDYVTDCPYPELTMKLLYECREKHHCYFIRGNREDYLIGHRHNPDDGWCYSSSAGALLYTYENLTDADLDFFEAMPISMDIKIDGCPTITACHANPDATTGRLYYEDDNIDKYLEAVRGDVLLCGHSHKSRVYRCAGKTALFLSSIGMPEGKNVSEVTVLEYTKGQWEYRTIPVTYDKDALIAEFSESGLEEKASQWAKCIAKMLRENHNYPNECLSLAWEKAHENGYRGGWVLPEKYWDAAAQELGM